MGKWEVNVMGTSLDTTSTWKRLTPKGRSFALFGAMRYFAARAATAAVASASNVSLFKHGYFSSVFMKNSR